MIGNRNIKNLFLVVAAVEPDLDDLNAVQVGPIGIAGRLQKKSWSGGIARPRWLTTQLRARLEELRRETDDHYTWHPSRVLRLKAVEASKP